MISRARRSGPLLAMVAMYFLVVCAVGILRPIKNALALDGLGATDFYKVYLVSAAVVLFVPLYTRLADRYAWRRLISGVAAFFALNLVLFRLFYVPGSGSYGLIFYGWYDLFAAALVTQFFIATQLYLNTRSAKRAYPLIIAGGSLGATLGGAITGFFASAVGTPNLLLVAAGLIVIFSLGIPFVLGADDPAPPSRSRRAIRSVSSGELREVFGNRQVQFIAATVLMTILVKQLIDYQFNVVTKEVFIDRDAISAFQGKFNAATQWLPILVLAVLRPGLRRWGVGIAVLMLPVFMVAANVGLAVLWGLWAATAAKGGETALRYSAERTGREILYVPVPDEIKLKAKAYIDVAVEKGAGKVLSALLIFVLLQFIEYRQIAFVAVGASLLWLGLAIAVRREYVGTLARSIEGRFASLRGAFASLVDANALPAVRRALASGTALQTAFALDLVEQASARDLAALAGDLAALVEHPSNEIRVRALNLLARVPDGLDQARVRRALGDDDPAVREAAVRALAAAAGDGGEVLIRELIGSADGRIRSATLGYLARGGPGGSHRVTIDDAYLARHWSNGNGGSEARLEVALAVGVAGSGVAMPETYLEPLLDDSDPGVRATALRSAGRLVYVPAYQRMVAALGSPATRDAARDALVQQGASVVPLLAAYLHDAHGDTVVRRNIPAVLARIPHQETVDALIQAVIAPETDQLLDYRALKALGKLRAREVGLHFPEAEIVALAEREVDSARAYAASGRTLEPVIAGTPAGHLLRTALLEAIDERREGLFRCLGLLYDSEGVYRAFMAATRGSSAARANAFEWLERTLGFARYQRLAALLENGDLADRGSSLTPAAAIARLRLDGDTWIARCATAISIESNILEARLETDDPAASEATMQLIEKVFLLQRVDLLHGARGSHLALLASIAEESHAAAGTPLIRQGEPPDALYVVRRGAVELERAGERLLIEDGAALGTWALIDDAPSPYEARAVRPTHLLRIDRGEFQDLLADNPELALGLLQGLARRVRSLVA